MADRDAFYSDVLDELYDGVYFVDRNRRITYWNRGAERLTGYKAADVVGTHSCDELLRHVDNEGRILCEELCPIVQAMATGKRVEADIFLHHKRGHLVPVSVRTTPIRNSDGEIAGAVQVFGSNTARMAERKWIEDLERMAYLDALTGLPNRRFAEMHLHSRCNETARYGWVFGLLYVDIDHFKAVNDAHGHEVGDEVLKMVARTLINSARPSDLVARWGGEEFLVIVANVGDEELRVIAERLRILVQRANLFKNSQPIRVTLTIGGTLSRTDDTMESVLRRSDELMYEGKQAGRNRVVIKP